MKILIVILTLLPSILFSQSIEPETAHEYDRKIFGNWADENNNCINTRHEVLMRDALYYATDKSGCKVISGVWRDYYTNEILTDIGSIDIDHVVPLREMWDSGLYSRSNKMLRKIYNDMDNLVVTHRSVNRSKSSYEPHEWRQLNSIQNACGFIIKWFNIKTKFNLSFDEIEYDFILNSDC